MLMTYSRTANKQIREIKNTCIKREVESEKDRPCDQLPVSAQSR